jgi:hypothetical protein
MQTKQAPKGGTDHVLTTIWNVDELIDDIKTVRFNIEEGRLLSPRQFKLDDLVFWERRRIEQAIDFQGQNGAIDDTAIVNTIRHIMNAREVYESRYVID